VAFKELRGIDTATISAARGEAPVYMLDGVVYLRQGSSDVQAQPDDVISLARNLHFEGNKRLGAAAHAPI
jgi:hypothetical protein